MNLKRIKIKDGKTNTKKMKIERRGPDSEPKMRYFKIPLCRNF